MYESYRSLILLRDAGLLVILAIVWFWPNLAPRFFSSVERWGTRVSRHRTASVLVVMALVIAFRLSLLPLVKVPVPQTHDEFSYLLAGDTFAHGRLANPPHPLWVFFETFHVNQLPTYASKYPPGQGAVLAVGELLGNPWIGVLLSVACLCGAITWALRGWMNLRWAFLGGILAVFQFGAVNYWIESYWGGAVAAIGGALVMGAFPRILKRRRARDSILFAVGMGILANSRPYEGGLFTMIFLVALACLLVKRGMILRRETFVRVVMPITATLILAGAFIGYYNWRVTGNPMLLPYVVNNRSYMAAPAFQWQKLYPVHHYRNPQFESFYGDQRAHWGQEHFRMTWDGIKVSILEKLDKLQTFYAPPELGIPIVFALLLFRRNKKVRFCVLVSAIFIPGLLCILWLLPHYAAPFTITVYVLIMIGFRSLRRWKVKGRPVGVGLTRVLVLSHILLLMAQIVAVKVLLHGVTHRGAGWAIARAQIESKLESTPGQHLILVHYAPEHDANQEWVFNHAEIDQAKVVWAREIPGENVDLLVNYFRGRNLWVVEPDAPSGPKLERLQSSEARNQQAKAGPKSYKSR